MEGLKPGNRRLIILAVVIIVLIGVFIIALDWQHVARTLSQAHWLLLLPAIAFTAVSYSCLSYSFVVINNVFENTLKVRDLFEIGFVSTVLGYVFSLGGVPENTMRLLLMKPRGCAAGDILAASVFYTYLKALAMLILFPVGIIYVFVNQPLWAGALTGFGIALAIVVSLIVFATGAIFSPLIRSRFFIGIVKVFRVFTHRDITESVGIFESALDRGVRTLRRRPTNIVMLTVLYVFELAAVLLVLHFCFVSLGKPIGVGVLVTGFAIGITAGILIMVPGGFGIQEGSMAGVIALLGVPFEDAILAAVLFRVVYNFVPFILSLPVYQRLLSMPAVARKTDSI